MSMTREEFDAEMSERDHQASERVKAWDALLAAQDHVLREMDAGLKRATKAITALTGKLEELGMGVNAVTDAYAEHIQQRHPDA